MLNILKNFIVFEGIDGAGTTTQAKLLANKLENSIFTFEPTDSFIGKIIRDILKNKLSVSPITLAYLFASDRSNHLYNNSEGIIELCKKKIVISDRYIFSSLAYQSLDLSFEQIFDLNKYFPLPEIVFFINTDIDISFKRVIERNTEKEIFEKKELQEKVLNNYIKIFKFYRDNLNYNNIYELDGSKSIDELLNEEINILKKINFI